MAEARPTAAEKADAAHRLADALEKVQSALRDCGQILRERQPAGSYNSYPLFWEGDKIDNCIRKAREALWEANRPVSHQGFTEGRDAAREALSCDGSSPNEGGGLVGS